MKKNIFGFIPSKMDGSERVFGASGNLDLPEEYTYRAHMAPIIDQKELQICVPCSVSAYLNWRENLKDGSTKDNKIALMDIYNCRTNEGDGMSFKDAFRYLRHHGVESNLGLLKINAYGRVLNMESLKYALVMNGPCVGALPVYSDDFDFWVKKPGYQLQGYHAISIMGYDKDGFFIRNSWGTSFGRKGYTHIDYEDFGELLEVWTIID